MTAAPRRGEAGGPEGGRPDGAASCTSPTGNRVRKITPAGDHHHHRGTGLRPASPATAAAPTAARLCSPDGLAVDGAGDVYIWDPGDEVVRAVDAAGVIWTVAGSRGAGRVRSSTARSRRPV